MYCDGAVSERQTLIENLQDVSLVYLAHLKAAGGRAFSPLGFTYAQAMLLTLVERGHTTPTELTGLLGIVPSALSALTTHLEGKGLVVRSNNPSDTRRVTLSLTPRGVDAHLEVQRAWRENFPIDLQTFSDAELQHLIEAARIATRHGLI